VAVLVVPLLLAAVVLLQPAVAQHPVTGQHANSAPMQVYPDQWQVALVAATANRSAEFVIATRMCCEGAVPRIARTHGGWTVRADVDG